MTKHPKSVYVICTGGTIAMQKTAKGYVPLPGYIERAMVQIPELKNADMPRYAISSYEKPIDSANMTPAHWVKMGEEILQHYDAYDGFVILHGTDTMAYTASALSFMLEHLGKPVILTGSQLPLFETRNDAHDNLINAIVLAGNYSVPEVCVYFNNSLFRGNRCVKINASSFSAFASPNFPELGKVGMDIEINPTLVRLKPEKELQLQKINPISIEVLRIFPGLPTDILQKILQVPLKALVLETYGLGNAPEDPDFLKAIHDACDRGIIIVNCSQCHWPNVKMHRYATGNALLKAGVVSGFDMTVEAALTKLYYLFSKNLSIDEIKKQMMSDLRGELTL